MSATALRTTAPPPPAEGDGTAPAAPLAEEHAVLLRDVTRRAAPVISLLDARVWPHAELGALTAFLRTTVLRQVADEEARLYPRDTSAPPFAELSAEHVRLHAITGQLERLHVRPCRPHELRVIVEQLLTTLERHLRAEQAVFAALLPHTTDQRSSSASATMTPSGPRR